MSLKQQLTDDMKAAMKAGEKDRLGVIRLINAAIKQKEVDERVELDDAAKTTKSQLSFPRPQSGRGKERE